MRMVAVNDRGAVIGEDHHRARLTDHDVWLVLELREDGMSYRQLAEKFDCSRESIADLCKGRRRGQTACAQKAVDRRSRLDSRCKRDTELR